jgi:membrane-associated protein
VTSLVAAPAALAALPALGPSWLDPSHLDTFGAAAPWVAAAIIFAECGLLVGFFLPGDTLLFTMGLLVGTQVVHGSIWAIALILATAAFLGNVVGYEIGRAAGPAIFRREDSALFKRENVDRAAAFFDRWGAPAVTVARFVPIVRTFITVTAGVGRMDRRRYLGYSGLGAVLWASGVVLLGYYLGSFQVVRDHADTILSLVEVVLVAVVVLSVVPILIDVWRRRRARASAARNGAAGSLPPVDTAEPLERREQAER